MQQVEQVEWKARSTLQAEMNEKSLTSSKNMATELMIGVALAAELMVGFWFAVGTIFAIKMVNSLEELISRK